MRYKFLFISILLSNCFRGIEKDLKTSSGEALGTYYQIKYISPKNVEYTREFDSVFKVVNNSLSTYKSNSIISRVNRNDTSVILDELFKYVFNTSKKVFSQTGGFFDPTIGTITTIMHKQNRKANDLKIGKLLKLVNFDGINIENDKVIKKNKKIALDFNAIAKGYTLDLISNIFDSNGVKHYLIEIGGEIKAKGKNIHDKYWLVGIELPEKNKTNRSIYAKISLINMSMATSGTYRNFFYEKNDTISHIIDPINKSHKKNKSQILSATVITDSCILADAYATSLISMGLDNAKNFLNLNKKIEALLIYKDKDNKLNTFGTKYFKELIKD